jgi:HPt (histidine-containing phosphotransfer) domain-containing protein
MLDDFAKFLPQVNVAEGKARVMNNLKLYITLLGRFKGRQMTDDLLLAMRQSNTAMVAQHGHALKGTAANLSFPQLIAVTSEIEELAKSGTGTSHLCDKLEETFGELDRAIKEITAMQY